MQAVAFQMVGGCIFHSTQVIVRLHLSNTQADKQVSHLAAYMCTSGHILRVLGLDSDIF